MTKPLESASTLALVFISLCTLALYGIFYEGDDFYSVVDNTEVEYTVNGYRYHLESYDKKGHTRTVPFRTLRPIPNGLILKLRVSHIRGVKTWEKITYDDLPDNLKIIYRNYESSFFFA